MNYLLSANILILIRARFLLKDKESNLFPNELSKKEKKAAKYKFEFSFYLTFSQTSPCFQVSAVQVF